MIYYPNYKRMKLVIIDDNIEFSECIKFILENKGFNVYTISNNFNNLENTINNIQPNLIFMDIQLGNMDGKIISRNLKINPKTSNIPIIALTCINTKKAVQNIMMESYCNAYISKDFTEEELISIIKIYSNNKN